MIDMHLSDPRISGAPAVLGDNRQPAGPLNIQVASAVRGCIPQLAIEPTGLPKGQQMVCDAEASKARVVGVAGKDLNLNAFLHSAFVDDEYLVIGSHVDESLCNKIVNHEYVDFAWLLPRDRVSIEEDQQMQLINQDGMTYWAPVADRDLNSVSSFAKWETAFRVFANIYMTQYPNKAAELIQYSHVIHTASLSYVCDNVYLYNKEFRLHLSQHPPRSWSVIFCSKCGICDSKTS